MAKEGAIAVCMQVRLLNSREEALGKDTQVYWKTDNNTVFQVDGSKSFNFGKFIIASKVNLVSFFYYEYKSLMNNTGFVTKIKPSLQ